MTDLVPEKLRARYLSGSMANSKASQALFASLGVLLVAITAGIAFLLRFNLSTAGSIELLLVVFVALRLGFFQATVVSIGAVFALNYLFTPPIFKFTVADPRNWVSLITFEATALFVSGLSSKARIAAAEAELQRQRSVKLYELSRAILLIDGRSLVAEQLVQLIREIIVVDEVELRIFPYEDPQPLYPSSIGEPPAPEEDTDHPLYTRRILRLGTSALGVMTLHHWDDPLTADAVASLAAIAIERARAVERENRAEAERKIEQLRTAVLDGLAHGFKTPLTAIQTASSGLLAIDGMSPTQTELVSIIDEEAQLLTHLTTRLLQTAALESRDVRLHRADHAILELLERVLQTQTAETRARIHVDAAATLLPVVVDAQTVELALLQLIDNAAKYATVGGPIFIHITQSQEETSVVIENDGSSIRPEEREKIFQRFYRGIDTASGPTGTGLGLSIVRKTAEAHGGKAWVECEDGTTRFFFTLQHIRKARHG